MLPRRPFVSTEQRTREVKLRLLTKEIYGKCGSIGLETGNVYLHGRHGRVFDPTGRDFNSVLEWMASKQKDSLIEVINHYSDILHSGDLRTMIVNKAVWLADMLEYPKSYMGILLAKPSGENPRFFTYKLFAGKENVERLQNIKDYALNTAVAGMTITTATPYVKLALRDILNELDKTRKERPDVEGWIFGVGALYPHVSETEIISISYANTKENIVVDMSPKTLLTENGIVDGLAKIKKIGVHVP